MNFSDYEALESLFDFESDESDEAFSDEALSDEGDESDEARRGRRRRPFRPRVPSGKNLYKPRPQGNYVTQVQLKSALDRVGTQIKVNSEATKALSARVNAVTDRLDKEAATRKKQDARINRQIQKGRESALLPLLLQKPPDTERRTINVPVVPPGGGTAVTQPIDVVTNVKQPSDNLLPLILLMGMGGGGDGKGSDDNSMLMLALVLSQGSK